MWWTVVILATIISINSTLSNPQPVILDYKTLCGEKLFKCVYNSVTLSTVTAGSLAAVVDPFDLAIQNTTVVVEISTSHHPPESRRLSGTRSLRIRTTKGSF